MLRLFTIIALAAITLSNANTLFAQTAQTAPQWDAMLIRTEGWLGADGVYSLDLSHDSLTNTQTANAQTLKLFWFSDTIYGATKNEGKEFGRHAMVNHSFALLNGSHPDPDRMEFFFDRNPNDDKVDNLIPGYYWLQDGIRIGSKVWLTGILVGDAWKPKRIDAITFELDPTTGRPDFSTVKVDESAPLWLKTDQDLLDLGAGVCDDAQDGFIYVYGYVDRLKQRSRKDLVVARVSRESFDNYSQWRYFDGEDWSDDINVLLDPKAALVRGVSTEFSVSTIPSGKNQGKFVFVYTPGTINSRVAFRIGETPFGPFGEEHVFYKSSIPDELPGIRCYNAKAHPIVTTDQGVLVSYNTNRLGDMAHKPEEYRPRFIWLTWEIIDKLSN